MDYAAARRNMVDGQILPNKVTDPLVIEAMRAIPRELFVPKHLKAVAYADEDLALGNGRSLIEPVVLARMLQALAIEPHEVALLLPAGTGYTAAVLSRLANTVVAVESDGELAERANAALSDLSIDNVAVIGGDYTQGRADQGPFDLILIDGAVEEIPAALTAQLADGGRLVAVVRGPGASMGLATLVSRQGDAFGRRPLFDACIAPLAGFEKPQGFVF